MKRVVLFLWLFIQYGMVAYSQTHSTDFLNYSITRPEYMPTKRIRLVIHVFQKTDGSGNIPDDSAGRAFLQRIIHHTAFQFTDVEYMKPYPAEKAYTLIPDTRIRIVVDTVMYHQNTDDWNFKKYTSYYDAEKKDTLFEESEAWSRAQYLYKKYVTDNIALTPRLKDSSLHIFLVEAERFQNRGMAERLGNCRWIYFMGAYYDMQHGNNHWDPGNTLSHEIGHAIGLNHPYDYGNRCKDVPFTPRGATNNVMDGWPNGGRAWTPQQIALAHYTLSNAMHRIVIRDWDTFHPDSEISIHKRDTLEWNCPMYLTGNLKLERQSQLILNSTVYLPPGGKIILQPGSVLFIKGNITTDGPYAAGSIKIIRPRRVLFLNKEKPGKVIYPSQ